jgi:alpha-mannosidase
VVPEAVAEERLKHSRQKQGVNVAGKAVPEDGYLREWLVLGSFPGYPRDLMVKALIPEPRVLPSAGQKQSGAVWKALKSADRVVNLESLTRWWPQHSQCCGYAHVYVYSSQEAEGCLSLGSDDGAVLWFNGQRVFALGDPRGNQPDQDRIAVRVQKGWNRILAKILQYDGAWSFCLRLLDSRLQPLPLTYSLNDPLKGRWPARPQHALPLALLLQPPSPADCLEAKAGAPLGIGLLVQNMGEKALSGVKLDLHVAGARTRTLPLPELKPVASHALRFELPLELWAHSYAEPLRVKAHVKGKAISSEQSLKTGLGSAFVAAAREPLAGLLPAQKKLLEELRQEIGAASEVLDEMPDLAQGVAVLTLALLRKDLKGSQAALDLCAVLLQRAHQALGGQAVHLVGHAHIDMNWLWRWNETVQCCSDTFSQALRFMEEFPSFRFTQSQASVYAAMQEEEPELFKKIQAAVKSGHWNIVGGMWTEGDTNLPSGEATARSCLLAQRYFAQHFGKRATVGWLPDNFGHAAQLPQILRLSGMDAFYHSRTGPEPQLYWWEGLDGSRLLAKTGQGYNDAVSSNLRREPARLPQGVGEQMFVYGVGDHGGGPTRRDIEGARAMQGRKLFPQVRFSTADEYFKHVRPKSDGLHVQRGELGYIFEGCYTNIAAIKQGNRDLENALQSAEALAWAASQAGLAWPKAMLEEAWKVLVFNHFHDILPGSAIHPSNDDTRAFYARGLQLANQVRSKSLRYIGSQVGLEKGDGIPVVVFNPLAWERDEVAEAEVIVTERFHRFKVLDPQGREVNAQVVRTRDFGADYHVWVQFQARQVPGFGYQTYRFIPMNDGEPVQWIEWGEQKREPIPLPQAAKAPKSALQRQGFKIRNPFFEAVFDGQDGSIRSLKPLRGGKLGANVFAKGGGNKLGIHLEKPHPMSAWTLDPTAEGPFPVKSAKPVEILQEGPASITLCASLAYGRSELRLLTTVYADSPRIDCTLKADWLEKGTASEPGPMLRGLWHLASTPKALTSDVPYGVLDRDSGREVAAQRWVDVEVPGGGLALFNRGKYGHSLEKNTLRLSLLRSSYDPDAYPDLGHHEIQWALQCHGGDYQAARLPRLGYAYNVPLECFQARAQKGPLPQRHRFLTVDSHPAFVVTGLKQAEEGAGTVLRGYDSGGKGGFLELGHHAAAAQAVNILEEPLPDLLAEATGDRVRMEVKAWGIVSLRWVQR